MAEGLMKRFYGLGCYVQSAGVRNDREIDGFAVAVCREMGVELERHRSRSFDEMRVWGDDLASFDLILALSPASQRRALDLTRLYALTVEYWPILDPTGLGEGREARLGSYRQARDMIVNRLIERWGPPTRPLAPPG
jgi:arsenate reductase